MAPQAFKLRIPDTAIADLKSRLSLTRFPDAAPRRTDGEPWAYGSSVDYIRDLVSYWEDIFDWRVQEAALNVFTANPVSRVGPVFTRGATTRGRRALS